MADQGFREIQLSGKQLVFLFIASAVLAVAVFLLGVSVGAARSQENAGCAVTAEAPRPTVRRPMPPPTALSPEDTQFDDELQGKTPTAAARRPRRPPPWTTAAVPTAPVVHASPPPTPAAATPRRPASASDAKPVAARRPWPQTAARPPPAKRAQPPAARLDRGGCCRLARSGRAANADAQVRQLIAKGYSAVRRHRRVAVPRARRALRAAARRRPRVRAPSRQEGFSSSVTR